MSGRFGAWLAGWRAAVRIARRDAWRNKGRSGLIALMILLPILAACTISVLYESDDADPADRVAMELGSAQASVTWGSISGPIEQSATGDIYTGSGGPATVSKVTTAQFERRLQATLPAGDRIVSRTASFGQAISYGDRLIDTALVELDYPALGSGGTVQQVSGRAPATATEVVVSSSLARHSGIGVGDRISATVDRDGPRSYTVVGVVGGRPLTGQREVIGRPQSLLPGPESAAARTTAYVETSYLVVGPAPVSWADVKRVNQLGAAVLSRAVVANPPKPSSDVDEGAGSSVDSDTAVTGAVVIALVLLQIALMAGPAIAVGARRNERSLAVVAAAGGQRRHLRAVVLAGSALIGLVASLVAAVAGAGLGALLVPILRSQWEVDFPRTDIRLRDLAVLVAVGTVTAFLAALLPARRVGRLDVVAALTGRRPARAPKLRVPFAGLLIAAAGAVLAWVAAGTARQAPTVVGLAIAEVGLVMASPAFVALAARAGARAPFATRFALRDAARQRGRTAPAVAAVLAAIAGGTTAVVFIAASDHADRTSYRAETPLAAAAITLDSSQDKVTAADIATLTRTVRPQLPVRSTAVLDRTTSRRTVNVSEIVDCAQMARDTGGSVTSAPEAPEGECTYSILQAYFADPDAAPLLAPGPAGAQAANALRAGKVVVFDPAMIRADGTASVSVTSASDDSAAEPKPLRLPAFLVRGDPLSTTLVPRTLARTLGVQLVPGRVLVATTRMPTPVEEERADQALRRTGLGAELQVERGYHSDSRVIVLAYLIAAALVALLGAFIAVGLASAEGRADAGTLAAVGAAPRLRRRLAAAQAAAIVVPGALLGVVSGTVAGWVLIRLNAGVNSTWGGPGDWRFTFPVDQIALVGVGIPALAVAVGFLTVRSRLTVVRRLGE